MKNKALQEVLVVVVTVAVEAAIEKLGSKKR